MRAIKDVDCAELLSQFQNTRDFQYIAWAIQNHNYCYLIALDANDLQALILNSSPKMPAPAPYKDMHPCLGEAIREIERQPEFLNFSPSEDFRGLNGRRVKERIEDFEKGIQLKECFIMDASLPVMLRSEPYYVIDGMHRLVAYAIWSQMSPDKFPVNVWLCTNFAHQVT